MHNWASGLIPQNSSTPEAITTTLSFSRSDKPVCTTQTNQSLPTYSDLGRTCLFSPLQSPIPFPGGVHGRLYALLGCPYGGLPDFRYLDPFRPQTPYQRFGTQSLIFGLPSLGHSATGPPSYESYGQYHSSVLYPQTGWEWTGWDPFPYSVSSSSGSGSFFFFGTFYWYKQCTYIW